MEVAEAELPSETRSRARWVHALGILLAIAYVAVVCLVALTFGLAGLDFDELIITQFVIGVLLLPLGWLAVTALRKGLPRGTRAPILIAGVTLFVLIATLRSFNVGVGGPSWLWIPMGIAAFVGPAWLSSFAVADLVRFRSPRLAAVAIPTFVVLLLPSAGLGFSLASECQSAHAETVLADIEANGRDSAFAFTSNEPGRCGVVAWSNLQFADGNGDVPQVIFHNSGGLFANVDGFVWSPEPLDGCRDIDVNFCENGVDLGDGWHSYELGHPGAT